MEFGERTRSLLEALGYLGRETFFMNGSREAATPPNHIIRQALSEMGVDGVYTLNDGFGQSKLRPIVYVATAADNVQLRAIWKKVWSQGAVPFLLVVMPSGVAVCNGFQAPHDHPHISQFDTAAALPDELECYSASRISSSVTWNDFDLQNEVNIDNSLVRAIGALNEKARADFPHLDKSPELINALIGKFIYTYVLIDRQILTVDWLATRLPRHLASSGSAFIAACFGNVPIQIGVAAWTVEAVMATFKVVDDAINGSVFQIAESEYSKLPIGLFKLIHRVVREGEILQKDGSQLSFFNVSFAVLRTETISAIYEQFVAIEDEGRKKDDGVYYTPPHLADHVLDRLETVRAIDRDARLIDPAAGSGIFLVGAYRRLMERHAPPDGWKPEAVDEARALLLSSIFGFEKHSQAANVCRFSLYLTLLDYVGRASIERLVAASADKKFLPDLSSNIRSINAFSALAAKTGRKFTHVVGNPPWAGTGGQKDRTNQIASKEFDNTDTDKFILELAADKIPFGHNRLSDLFVWLAKRRLAEQGGAIALILPARSLIGRQAKRFAYSVGRELTLRWVGNFSHLRRKLFSGSEAPACLVVATNQAPVWSDRVEVYRPLLSSLPVGRRSEIWALLTSSAGVQVQRSRDFQTGENGWFRQIMLSDFDRRMNDALSIWARNNRATFGDFLDRSGLRISKGGSPMESGVSRGGSDKKVQLVHLNPAELPQVKPDFRGRFAGNTILVPRSMATSKYFRDPIAYPSTFNGIVPEEQYRTFKENPYASVRFMSEAVIEGILAYLNSDVLQYFASIFGATYLMDKARFERNDLISLPCPFPDIHDQGFARLAGDQDSNGAILTAMNAGDDFRRGFDEFKDFRRGFANAQLPPKSMVPPDQSYRDLYLKHLAAEIQSSFRADRSVSVYANEVSAEQTDVIVRFDTASNKGRSNDARIPVDVSGSYLGSSIIFLDRDRDFAAIAKPPARFAWTIDQAVADAAALAQEIRTGR